MRTYWPTALLTTALTAQALPALASAKPESLIPLDRLDAAARARVGKVVPGYTFYRQVRVARDTFTARFDLFEYLINHLDQSSIVAQPLKIVQYRSQRTADGGYWADNRKGAVGYLWPLYAAPGERLYFAQGSDRAGKPVAGCAVVVVRYREQSPGVITCEMHAFVRVERWIQRLLARIFLPLVTGTVDRRFSEVLEVPVLVSEQATADPAKVIGVIDALPPEDRAMLQQFRRLLVGAPADSGIPPGR
ncbi:MAG: hypothetical protein FJ388_13010 [Verrucomicrobia bacterium]|nr:hypothetical protein [Verrucomicrobiota bacterium]